MSLARFSQACENNKQPIIEQLKVYFSTLSKVLEIGSGTGQHAVYFAPELAHLSWHTSDRVNNHDSINAWLAQYPSANLYPPLEFNVGVNPWPLNDVDGVFTANTAHIMQPDEVELMMSLVAQSLPSGGVMCQYGPFTFDGRFTSDSNRAFDAQLRAQGYGGLVDVSSLKKWASPMKLAECIDMPANNQLLVWRN
ncbi:DUF938 domain-containing protein [Aestuariibacter salexigens]|uniref:DUF938 domain-containing protein n=1 Tax=Aestuariibacter salexigens TaxID=226010 RepID=UPI00042815C1|nr:DUF938 domain-containing protein [Aestuariibacter salexigens]